MIYIEGPGTASAFCSSDDDHVDYQVLSSDFFEGLGHFYLKFRNYVSDFSLVSLRFDTRYT